MAPDLSKEGLHKAASWIRDSLDPRIARGGPDVISSDEVLALHELFVGLRAVDLHVSVLRYSRIHAAILEVAGRATRWPSRLVEECDRVIDLWESKYGKLSDVRPRLFAPDGRLHGACTGKELTRDALLRYWQEHDPAVMDESRPRQHGDLGFRPGDWWINGMFAFHAGIIDLKSTDGGIVADKYCAYALVLKDTDEVYSETPDKFQYRCRPGDRGRYRMTSADFKSRYPIRVLRSHNLASLWAPRSGIRYEGLYKVTGWTVRPASAAENKGESIVWLINLERDTESHTDDEWTAVLNHPSAEETDDYVEYKRIRKEVRDGLRDDLTQNIPPTPEPESPLEVDLMLSPMSEAPNFWDGRQSPPKPTMPPMPPMPPMPAILTPEQSPPPLLPNKPPFVFTPPRDITASPASRPNKLEEAVMQQSRTMAVAKALRKTMGEPRARKSDTMGVRKSRSGSQADLKGFSISRHGSLRSRLTKPVAKMLDGQFDRDQTDSPPSDEGQEEELPSPSNDSQLNELDTLLEAHLDSLLKQDKPRLDFRASKWERRRGKDARSLEMTKLPIDTLRDRVHFETLERQEDTEARQRLEALKEVWADCASPGYPDMVLEGVNLDSLPPPRSSSGFLSLSSVKSSVKSVRTEAMGPPPRKSPEPTAVRRNAPSHSRSKSASASESVKLADFTPPDRKRSSVASRLSASSISDILGVEGSGKAKRPGVTRAFSALLKHQT
ncbi:uncharacterized protein K452DRAFT_321479 [Aplosporella prunicola CBS 121167]|uniref:Uncharacterized protein n=1 Tax=Aplosporella prunicola CBS 121167 TaxID=1176127 RepID=A0A6A6B251_9PEZI|nr:uncharacterized protein K452DRAFT_321479 [Aplosporella prunicola CBS 121167]KAF2138130.1 hypothetical protein K452DRAFT_321479 [Aplosporella prunicola CBS 121167]